MGVAETLCSVSAADRLYSFPGLQQLNKNLGYRQGGSITALISVSLDNANDEVNGSLGNMAIIPDWVGQSMCKDCCADRPES